MIKTRYTNLLPEITPKMVDVYHDRNFVEDKEGLFKIDCKGGCTRVVIHTLHEGDIQGVAHCNTLDNYNKKMGYRMAMGRAMKNWYRAIVGDGEETENFEIVSTPSELSPYRFRDNDEST